MKKVSKLLCMTIGSMAVAVYAQADKPEYINAGPGLKVKLPTQFILLDKEQLAAICAHGLTSEAISRYFTSSASIDAREELLISSLIPGIAWEKRTDSARDTRTVEQWKVAFDAQGAESKFAQRVYCYEAISMRIKDMPTKEQDSLMAQAKESARVLGTVKARAPTH